MKLPTASLLAFISFSALAQAIQPAESGAQPIRSRLNAIDTELQLLDNQLRSATISGDRKVELKYRLVRLKAEKQQIEAELEKVRTQESSPFIKYGTTTPQGE